MAFASPLREHTSPFVQAKLTIGEPNDTYEQEADAVADQVMKMPSNSTSGIQRKCAKCEEEELQMKPLGPPIRPIVQKRSNAVGGNAPSNLSQPLSGSKGSGQPMPTATQQFMGNGFGTDFSHVKIHTDNRAVQMNRQLNAKAFTNGSDIYFNQGQYNPQSTAGKHLLAHELTHVVQQKGISNSIQRYTDVAGERVSDDGKMVVEDHTKNAWALESDIDKSNAIFSNISSQRSLKKTPSKRKVKVPGGTTEHELVKYEIDVPNLKKNCGRAALQMLGHNTTGEREYVGVTNKGTTQEFTKTIGYHGDDQSPGGILSTTEELSTEIYQKIFFEKEGKNLTRDQALDAWNKLSATKRELYSKSYGINEFAVPRVGQAITMGTEFDMPGFKDDHQMGRANSTWNFHFGTPVITSGQDYTTAENFTGSSHDYYFSMFGPHTKNQSWYDEQKGAGFGNKHTAMVVQHPETLTGEINANNVFLVVSPEKFNKDGSGVVARLGSGTGLKIIRKGMNWMKVEVTSGGNSGKKGWILNKYFTDV